MNVAGIIISLSHPPSVVQMVKAACTVPGVDAMWLDMTMHRAKKYYVGMVEKVATWGVQGLTQRQGLGAQGGGQHLISKYMPRECTTEGL